MPNFDKHSVSYTKEQLIFVSEACFAPIEFIYNPINADAEIKLAKVEYFKLKKNTQIIRKLEETIAGTQRALAELYKIQERASIALSKTAMDRQPLPSSHLATEIQNTKTMIATKEALLRAYKTLLKNTQPFEINPWTQPENNPWIQLEKAYQYAASALEGKFAYLDPNTPISNDKLDFDIEKIKLAYEHLAAKLKEAAEDYRKIPNPHYTAGMAGDISIIRLAKRIRITQTIVRHIQKRLLIPFFEYTPEQASITPVEQSVNLPSAIQTLTASHSASLSKIKTAATSSKPATMVIPITKPETQSKLKTQTIDDIRAKYSLSSDTTNSGDALRQPKIQRGRFMQSTTPSTQAPTPKLSWFQQHRSRIAWMAAAVLIVAVIATALIFAWPTVIASNLSIELYASFTPLAALGLSRAAYGIGKDADESRSKVAPLPRPQPAPNTPIIDIYNIPAVLSNATPQIKISQAEVTDFDVIRSGTPEPTTSLFPDAQSSYTLSPITSEASPLTSHLETPITSGLYTPLNFLSPAATPKYIENPSNQTRYTFDSPKPKR